MSYFLTLPPEQGGIKFGPFEGPTQLGSDGTRCQIVLAASSGVMPIHAVVGPAGGGTWSVAPAVPAAQTFVVQAGNPQLWPVQGPVQMKPGDALVLGGAAGPRFTLQQEGPGPSVSDVAASGSANVKAASAGMWAFFDNLFGYTPSTYDPNASMAQKMQAEAARRSRSRLLTKSPWREFAGIYARIRNGQLMSAPVIVGALFAVISALMAGGVTCSGLGYTVLRRLM